MIKQFILLALACGVAATAAKKLAQRRQTRHQEQQKAEVQRWEDEGGSVVEPATAAARRGA